MDLLDDKIIRKELKTYLKSKKNAPQVIVDELSIYNGMARADVVAFYNNTHCYEIKSDKDSLVRLDNQIKCYNYTFQYITIVITDKYIDTIQNKIPCFWGILLAETKYNNKISFKTLRTAKRNTEWESDKALLTLWKSELLSIDSKLSSSISSKSASRISLATKISSEVGKRVLSNSFSDELKKRYTLTIS